jgi:hypothetical protein
MRYSREVLNKKIDVTLIDEEVREFLHSKEIYERGEILSPGKDVWFKFYHYIEIINVATRFCWNDFAYKYITKSRKFEGVLLEEITFDQLKDYLK